MQTFCAWCKKEMPNHSEFKEAIITHGICSLCLKKLREEMYRESFYEFLDKLEAPVVVINRDSNIQAANLQAEKMLNRQREDMAGLTPGIVLKCNNAYRPGGCGKTEFCPGCVIYKAVKRTIDTGESVTEEVVFKDKSVFNDKENIDGKFLIGTEKVDDLVFLKIEPSREVKK